MASESAVLVSESWLGGFRFSLSGYRFDRSAYRFFRRQTLLEFSFWEPQFRAESFGLLVGLVCVSILAPRLASQKRVPVSESLCGPQTGPKHSKGNEPQTEIECSGASLVLQVRSGGIIRMLRP